MADNPHWFPEGGINQNGMQKPSDDPSYVHQTQGRMLNVNWPVLGVITNVHYADSATNKSQMAKAAESGTNRHQITGGGYLKSLISGTAQKGHRLECDVMVVHGLDGFADTPLFKNVPICIGFGGVEDFSMIVPKARNNASTEYERGTGNGDYCILQFIGGNIGYPIITAFYPHPLNTQDPPGVIDGKTAHFKFNGVKFYIDKKGDFYMDSTSAGQEVTVGESSGVVKRNSTVGTSGRINVSTKNDVFIAAGIPDAPGQEENLPFGKATLAASKEVNIISTKDDVKIQAPHKNLKKSARQFDSVKVNGGELFDYILKLKHMLFWMAQNMQLASKQFESNGDFALSTNFDFTATVMKEFLKNDLPSSAIGHITGGSNVCYVGSADFSALDIGNAELGLDDEDLTEIQVQCAQEAASAVLTDLLVKNARMATAQVISELAGQIIPIVELFESLLQLPSGTTETLKTATKAAISSVASGGDADTSELSSKTEGATGSVDSLPTDEEGNIDTDSPQSGELASDLLGIIELIGNLATGSPSEAVMSELSPDIISLVEDPDAAGGKFGGFYSDYTECVDKKIQEELDK